MRKDQQLGLEPTPQDYVDSMVGVFREARRVLRKHGTFWLNIGDSYASGEVGRHDQKVGKRADNADGTGNKGFGEERQQQGLTTGLRSKNLVGIPWRLAFALQDDGWCLRSENIWAKLNSMPESVKDRPTRNHEQVFMFVKSTDAAYYTHPDGKVSKTKPAPDYYWFPPVGVDTDPVSSASTDDDQMAAEGWSRRNVWVGHDYYFDQEASREPEKMVALDDAALATLDGSEAPTQSGGKWAGRNIGADGSYERVSRSYAVLKGANMRSVWHIGTSPFPEAHFATFPHELVEKCLTAGCPEQVCRKCGIPRERMVELVGGQTRGRTAEQQAAGEEKGIASGGRYALHLGAETIAQHVMVGWSECECADFTPGIVLDPFMGSGTTALVARALNRHAVGIELNPEYATMIYRRTAQQTLFSAEDQGTEKPAPTAEVQTDEVTTPQSKVPDLDL